MEAPRGPEDGSPRGGMDIRQAGTSVRYELTVRLQEPPRVWLVIRVDENDEVWCANQYRRAGHV